MMAVDFEDAEKTIQSSKPVLTCDFCKRKFLHLNRLKNHIEAHITDDETKRTCDHCKTVCKTQTKLKIHILKVHHNIQNRCNLCRELFESEEKLSKHRCSEGALLPCPDCGKKFTRKYYFNKHRLLHSKTALRCQFCYTVFMKQETYDTHLLKLSCSKGARYYWLENYEKLKCRVCSEDFKSEDEVLNHFIVWHPGKPFQCFWCNKDFNKFEELSEHVQKHVTERYTCHECNKAYTSQEGYRKHKLKHPKSTFKCKFCGKDYLSWSRFKLHEKSCNGIRNSQPTKLSRQLNWESRIIVKKVRSIDNESVEIEPVIGGILDNEESLDDRRGWFDDYYKTGDDFDAGQEDVNEIGDERSSDSSSDGSEEGFEDEIAFDDKICRICGDEFTFEFELLHHFIKVSLKK